MAKQKELLVLISSFAAGADAAISAWKLDKASGKLCLVTRNTGVEHPFFLALSPDYRFLYSIHEPKFGGGPSGAVSAFALDRRTGQLTFLNQESTGGPAACYLDVDGTGRLLLAANYSGGSVAALPIGKDGKLGKMTSFFQHEGKSVNASRQEKAHAHCFEIDPASRYAGAADLGLDKVMIYKLDAKKQRIAPGTQPFVRTHPGAGPRHFAFHPSAKFAYAINELDNTMIAFTYDAAHGILIEIQAIPTIPADFKGTTNCADVKVHPSGKFVYGTNRGHDSLAAYAIDKKTGKLSLIGIEPSQGKNPQNMAITPDGSLLLVANMGGGNVVTFAIDKKTGKLSPTGEQIQVVTPSCIMLVPAAD